MQIFIPFNDPKQVAMCLDKVRLHKQIIEADYIIDCIAHYLETGDSRCLKHPVMKMYKDNIDWVIYYRDILFEFYTLAHFTDTIPPPDSIPIFLAFKPLLDCHKKRLYQKGKKDQARRKQSTNHYEQFKEFDSSDESNLYVVDNVIYRYYNGKCHSAVPLFHEDLKAEDFVSLDTIIHPDAAENNYQRLNLNLFNEEAGSLSKDS